MWDSNREIFEQQLQLNMQQLERVWPTHWYNTIAMLEWLQNPTPYLIDVGCGCGALSEVFLSRFPQGRYKGFDYSPYAIDVAKKAWPTGPRQFVQKSWDALIRKDVSGANVIHQSALSDVLENGMDCVHQLLELDLRYVIMTRVFVDHESKVDHEYEHYGIKILKYHHGINDLYQAFAKYDYRVVKSYGIDLNNSSKFQPGDCDFLLTKVE